MTDPRQGPAIDPGGLAALSICESLIISLTEKGVLRDDEACFVLEDAANAHRHAVRERCSVALHEAAAQLIERLLAQSISVGGTDRLGVLDVGHAGYMDQREKDV